MDWDALAAFIRTEDPTFAAALRGVSREDLERVEREHAIRLPRHYRGFAQMMGRHSEGFYLFGPHRNQNFDDLVAKLPARTYPAQDYFKIGAACDPSEISPPDYFLDLTRSDGVDAPIVMFEDIEDEDIEPFDRQYVRNTRFTFIEQATYRIFTFLVLDRGPEHARMVIVAMSDEEYNAVTNAAIALLTRINFRPVLPSNSRIASLRRAKLAALVNVSEGSRSVTINVSADEGRSLKVVVDQLLDQFPESAVSRPGGPLGS